MFVKLDDALNWLYTRKRFSRRVNLCQMEYALKLLGSPEKSFKTIHIAGTNGKGSTATYIFHILKEKGIKCALYSSPHVVMFNERIRIMDEYISDDDALRLINYIHDFNEDFMKTGQETFTFFELLTMMSFIYFKENHVEIAVIECGLGGRLDATNVITPLVSIITAIQKDHMDVLGNTYLKIAKEKLGIVKDHIPLISAENREEIMPLFKDVCLKHSSELHFVRNISSIKLSRNGTSFSYKGIPYKVPLIGLSQPKDASMAIEAINILNSKYGYEIEEDIVKKGLLKTWWPGRFEFIKDNVILDGGHNEGALRDTYKTLKRFSGKKIVEIFGCMSDKDYKTMVEIIDQNAYKVIFTEINYPRALHKEELYNLSLCSHKYMRKDLKSAINFALKNLKEDEILLIHGSLYLVSEARAYLGGKKECLN